MIGSDDLYSPIEVGDDFGTALGTETLADRDVVSLSFGRRPIYRDLRAPEVPESRAQCKEADHTREECPGRRHY